MLYEVIPTRIFRQGAGILTYHSDEPLTPGQIILVPLGKKTTPAIVWQKVAKVDFQTRPITKILYSQPLPSHLLKSLKWLSEYYLTPLPTVAGLILPIGIEKKRRQSKQDGWRNVSSQGQSRFLSSEMYIPDGAAKDPQELSGTPSGMTSKAKKSSGEEILRSPLGTRIAEGKQDPSCAQIPLNPAQKQALKALQQAPGATKLLHGVTGSGKTNIYLTAALNALKQQRSTILLVPEIALTSQLVTVFQQYFPDQVILLHSGLTEAKRHLEWQNILQAKSPLIIIGPRSALFAPVKDLGLIIIDEAHESAYFQENAPKYSAVRLASFIAGQLGITNLLGTATPLVTDYHLAKTHNSLVPLSQKAKPTSTEINTQVIDLKNRQNFTKNRYFSDQLLKSIQTNLNNHHQSLIFHNRRGSAPLTICESCGWQALCPNCLLPLTLHSDDFTLRCHACGHQESVPTSCLNCHHPHIIHKGFGTKLLESELRKLFPDTKIARFDSDNTKQESLDHLYAQVKCGEYQIIIGTQTIAKGLDLPNLATVGVVQADAGLSLPDFAAEERTFQLLTQVIGRVGRGHLATAEAIIQTYQPDHPAIIHGLTADYDQFATYLLKKRRQQHFPPYLHLARVAITYKTERTTLQKIQKVHAHLHQFNDHQSSTIHLSAPTPAFHERTTSGYTWQITIRSRSRRAIILALQSLDPTLAPHITLDPPSLL